MQKGVRKWQILEKKKGKYEMDGKRGVAGALLLERAKR